jgi:hypothetical protein
MELQYIQATLAMQSPFAAIMQLCLVKAFMNKKIHPKIYSMELVNLLH